MSWVKRILAIVLMVVALVSGPGTAAASGPTLVPLRTPPPASLVNVHWGYCAASGFNADGTIAGVCTYSYGSGSRFRSSPTINYLTTWGPYGQIVGLGTQCTACVRNYQGTGTVVTINGVPYYYVATNPATGNQLVSSNVTPFLVLQTLPSVPAAPTITTGLVSGYVQVSWTPDPSTQSAITSSVVTVAPARDSRSRRMT